MAEGLKDAKDAKRMKHVAKYSGPGRSGICVCGHSWEDHHLGMVMRQEYVDDTKEGYIPQECEHFGNNEMGGLDTDGNEHCFGYHDSMVPDPHN